MDVVVRGRFDYCVVIAETTSSVILQEDLQETLSALELYSVLSEYTVGYTRTMGLWLVSKSWGLIKSMYDWAEWATGWYSGKQEDPQ